MSRASCLALALWLAAAVAQAKQAHIRNGLHYTLGGVVSGPIDLTIDFDTGHSVIVEGSPGSRSKLTAPRDRHLSDESISELRRLATRAIEQGLETKTCSDARAKGIVMPPIMDALLDMRVYLGDRKAFPPVRPDCWSKAANDLQSAAYRAATK